jgi:hypothetical protein
MMELQLTEMDVAVHALSNLSGNVQVAPHLSQTLEVKYEVMGSQFNLQPAIVMMAIRIPEMDVTQTEL